MRFHVLSYDGSPRLQTIQKRLSDAQISDYRIYEGKVTLYRYDGLFETIKQVVRDNYDQPFTILLEDDILFSENYCSLRLESVIGQGKELGADIILGGIKEGSRLGRVSEDLLKSITTEDHS